MKKQIFVFTDGGARGNPGPAAIGIVIKDERGKVLAQFGKSIGKTTNNVAEYQAVIEALKWIKNSIQYSVSSIQVFLDSKLIVNQLNGYYKIKNGNLRNLIIEVRKLEREVGGNISYKLIPRGRNRLADFLVNQTLDRKKF
jgi:ribonuclease HI